MKNRLMSLADQRILGRRAIIESVIDQLKNISQIVRAACRRQTLSSPFTRQLLGQFGLWIDCLLPPTQETIPHT